MKTNEEIKIIDIAGERVAVRQGSYGTDMTKIIAFNPVAEWLWNNLKGKHFTQEDIVNLLTNAYEIEPTQAEQDAKKWIKQCIEANIIHL
jgi:hypothetical protein